MPYVLTGGDEEGGGEGDQQRFAGPARLPALCRSCLDGEGYQQCRPGPPVWAVWRRLGGGGELAQLWPCLPAPGSCYATGLASAALYVSSQTKPAQPRGKQAKNALGWAFLGPTRMGLMALKSPPGV